MHSMLHDTLSVHSTNSNNLELSENETLNKLWKKALKAGNGHFPSKIKILFSIDLDNDTDWFD